VVEAALLWWNKVLRPSLHLAGDGLVRLGVGGSEGLADASASSTFCTGVLFRPVLQLGQWCFQGQIRGVMDHTPLQDSGLELELLPFLSGSSLMELRRAFLGARPSRCLFSDGFVLSPAAGIFCSFCSHVWRVHASAVCEADS
jgi:hypothetical protein